MSREFTREAVMQFLRAEFSWIWCKCLLRNLIHPKIFNLTKYREVLVKYSLPINQLQERLTIHFSNNKFINIILGRGGGGRGAGVRLTCLDCKPFVLQTFSKASLSPVPRAASNVSAHLKSLFSFSSKRSCHWIPFSPENEIREFQSSIDRQAINKLANYISWVVVIFDTLHLKVDWLCCLINQKIERRSLTSHHVHGSKISESQKSLTETAFLIVKRWKKSIGYRVVPECNHAQRKSYKPFFVF